MKKLIGVIGSGQCDLDVQNLAYQVGLEIGKKNYGLVCGGLGGVMEYAAKGCHESGGLTVGILPQEDAEYANPYIDLAIPTGMGVARNLIIVRSALGLIAVTGRYGTLSEIAYALQLGKPVVGLNTWDISEDIVKADNPRDAVDKITKLISS
ncbi:MAG: TIGR00725 family protein [Calditrichaceae bacterium]|nr:TIGR00725 family protein [Calditrichaceae bacterium]MBN2708794.1 TIGR00725 family protein [Calditrichaceae bacterium]RQV97676.1 MAG: TIGR00725 family protein [Calditrichota bacterium]